MEGWARGDRGDTGSEEQDQPAAGSDLDLPRGTDPDELLMSPEWDEYLRRMQEADEAQQKEVVAQILGRFAEEPLPGEQTVCEGGGISAEEETGVSAEGKPIPDAARLTAAEQATAGRLKERFPDRTFRESDHVGAEYIDDQGRSYDAVGTPDASKFWDEKRFFNAIDTHLRKSNDFTVVDLTGFNPEQVTAVRNHLDGLPPAAQAKFIRIGF